MATHSFKSVHQSHHSFRRRHSLDLPPSSSSSASASFLKPTAGKQPTLRHTLSFAAVSSATSNTYSSPSPSSSATETAVSFDLLRQLLQAKDFRQADEETRRLLIVLAGEAAQKRGYVFFSEVQFISETDLKAIDELWKQNSDGKFGYSVQKKIWNKVNRDFTKFFIKLGWMKKLDTEVEQYNYRSFPAEFIWEMDEETPEGHLPLTNALRGTQLLNCVLSHPAFSGSEEEEQSLDSGEVSGGEDGGSGEGSRRISKPLSKTVFKPDYSF